MGVSKDTPAIKFDSLKDRFDLIPAKPLRDLAWLYTKGSVKYLDRNWEKGMKWSRVYASTMRHLNKFWQGYNLDGETRVKHVIAAAWGCFALAEYIDTHRELDDRPRRIKRRRHHGKV